MAINTALGNSPNYFGHKDYYEAQKQGKTASEVLDFITANFNKLSPSKRNQPGGGGLYDQIFSDFQREQINALTKQQETLSKELSDYRTSALEERALFREQMDDTLAAFKATSAEDREALQRGFDEQLKAYRAVAAERQEAARRQMLIELQSKSKGPAPVRTAASKAEQQGLTTRGSTGYFGRRGLRIGSLNLPTSGMTISSGRQPIMPTTSTTPGSFN